MRAYTHVVCVFRVGRHVQMQQANHEHCACCPQTASLARVTCNDSVDSYSLIFLFSPLIVHPVTRLILRILCADHVHALIPRSQIRSVYGKEGRSGREQEVGAVQGCVQAGISHYPLACDVFHQLAQHDAVLRDSGTPGVCVCDRLSDLPISWCKLV